MAEVLESVLPDDLVIAGLQRLKQAGYLIALDDFTINDPRTPLTEMADIIKVDVRATKMEDCIAIAKKHGPWRCRLLAEKAEPREEFAAAKAAGFIYFQGYFFRRPEVLHTKEIPANRLNQLRLLKAVSQQEMDVRELETIIKQEASVWLRRFRLITKPKQPCWEQPANFVRSMISCLPENREIGSQPPHARNNST
jgi:EAL and modified HD-GYP domain-containing signal transduction protein